MFWVMPTQKKRTIRHNDKSRYDKLNKILHDIYYPLLSKNTIFYYWLDRNLFIYRILLINATTFVLSQNPFLLRDLNCVANVSQKRAADAIQEIFSRDIDARNWQHVVKGCDAGRRGKDWLEGRVGNCGFPQRNTAPSLLSYFSSPATLSRDETTGNKERKRGILRD